MNRGVKKFLFYIIIFTVPVMSIINYFNLFKLNSALSDPFVIIFIVLLLGELFKGNFTKVFKFFWYFIGLIVIVFLSNALAPMFKANTSGWMTCISESLKVAITAAYFYVGVNGINEYSDEKHISKIFQFWLVGTWIVIIVGVIIQINYFLGHIIEFNSVITPTRGRFLGTLTDANIAATYLGISFFIAYLLLNTTDELKHRKYYITTMISCFICILLTFSRGGLIAFTMSVILLISFEYKKITKKSILFVLGIFILIIFIADIDYTFLNGEISNQFIERIEQVEQKTGQYTVRKSLAKAAWEIGKDYPILGVGRGNYVINSKKYFEELSEVDPNAMYNYGLIPHNTILGYFAETGIIGTLFFLIVPFYLLWILLKNKTWINKMFLCIFLQITIHSLSINIENFRILWLLMGIAFSMNYSKIELKELNNVDRNIQIKYSHFCIILIIFISLVLDLGRKIPNNGEINERIVFEFDQIQPKKEYTLNYYIQNEEDLISVEIDEFDQNVQLKDSISYKYLKCRGFVEERLNFTDDIDKIRISIIPTNQKAGDTIIRDLSIINQTDNVKYNLLKQTQFLPMDLENLFNKYSLLKDFTTIEQELFGKDISPIQNNEIQNLKFMRKGLYSNVISYSIDSSIFNKFNSDEITITTSIVEKNLNNIPNEEKKEGIISFTQNLKRSNESKYEIQYSFGREFYNEHYNIYIKLSSPKKELTLKEENVRYINETNFLDYPTQYLEKFSLLEKPVLQSSNGFVESNPVLLDKGEYVVSIICKGSDFGGDQVYPLIQIKDYKSKELSNQFYITGESQEYNLEPIRISDNDTPMSFLIYFLNDEYYNENGIVKDRNLIIENIQIQKIW
jgi:O-antigen ligase